MLLGHDMLFLYVGSPKCQIDSRVNLNSRWDNFILEGHVYLPLVPLNWSVEGITFLRGKMTSDQVEFLLLIESLRNRFQKTPRNNKNKNKKGKYWVNTGRQSQKRISQTFGTFYVLNLVPSLVVFYKSNVGYIKFFSSYFLHSTSD